MKRSIASGVAMAIVGAVLVLLPATSASAGTCTSILVEKSLASGAASMPPGNGFWSFAPAAPYWSVIAGRGRQGENSDLSMYDFPANTCNVRDSSADTDAEKADWIALDNNSGRLPITTYAVDYTNAGEFVQQFVAGGSVLSTSEPSVAQTMGLGSQTSWIADIRDVWMDGGNSYSFKVTGGFSSVFVVHSKASDASTWTRDRDSATGALQLRDEVSSGPFVDLLSTDRTGTLTIHDSNVSGWFGFLVVRDGWWGNAVSVKVSVSTP